MKKRNGVIFVALFVICCIGIFTPAMGSGLNDEAVNDTRATGRFSMEISANSSKKASTSFPLEIGETVIIRAVYSPLFANVDFGLVAPDGRFYYVTGTDGSLDETVTVTEKGSYTLLIRNNSAFEISVDGFVNY